MMHGMGHIIGPSGKAPTPSTLIILPSLLPASSLILKDRPGRENFVASISAQVGIIPFMGWLDQLATGESK